MDSLKDSKVVWKSFSDLRGLIGVLLPTKKGFDSKDCEGTKLRIPCLSVREIKPRSSCFFYANL